MENGSSAAQAVVDLALGALNRRLVGTPNTGTPSTWQPQDPDSSFSELHSQIKIFEVTELLSERRLLVKLKYGFLGEFSTAVGDDEVPLEKHAASREFRALFLFPSKGTHGRLVVETHGQRCPVSMLVRWLSWEGYSASEEPKKEWMHLKALQIGDSDRITEMIKQADNVEIELTEKHPTKPGELVAKRRRLTESVTTSQQRSKLAALAVSMIGEHFDSQGYVSKIEQIAGYDPEELDEAGLHFDKGGIRVTDHNGESRLLTPDKIRDKFTYDQKDLPIADDDAWVEAAVKRVKGTLSAGTDIFA